MNEVKFTTFPSMSSFRMLQLHDQNSNIMCDTYQNIISVADIKHEFVKLRNLQALKLVVIACKIYSLHSKYYAICDLYNSDQSDLVTRYK